MAASAPGHFNDYPCATRRRPDHVVHQQHLRSETKAELRKGGKRHGTAGRIATGGPPPEDIPRLPSQHILTEASFPLGRPADLGRRRAVTTFEQPAQDRASCVARVFGPSLS